MASLTSAQLSELTDFEEQEPLPGQLENEEPKPLSTHAGCLMARSASNLPNPQAHSLPQVIQGISWGAQSRRGGSWNLIQPHNCPAYR